MPDHLCIKIAYFFSKWALEFIVCFSFFVICMSGCISKFSAHGISHVTLTKCKVCPQGLSIWFNIGYMLRPIGNFMISICLSCFDFHMHRSSAVTRCGRTDLEDFCEVFLWVTLVLPLLQVLCITPLFLSYLANPCLFFAGWEAAPESWSALLCA